MGLMSQREGAGSDAVAERSDESALFPLDGVGPFVGLEVAGFASAVVSVPMGSRRRRPVVVAAHGNYDTPESQCEIWRVIVGNGAFVLCPRGIARGDSPSRRDLRYEYASNRLLEKEIDAGVDALRLMFAEHVDDGPMLFAGFSLGAIMGVAIITRRPERYPRAVLIEGGARLWNASSARAYGLGGGQRVLFACGQWDCDSESAEARRVLDKHGVVASTVFSRGEGHTYGGGVAGRIMDALGWVVEGDARWQIGGGD